MRAARWCSWRGWRRKTCAWSSRRAGCCRNAQFDPAPLCSFGHGLPDGQWRAEFAPAGKAAVPGSRCIEVAAVPPGMGQYQLQVRVYPWHPLLTHPLEMGLMKTL